MAKTKAFDFDQFEDAIPDTKSGSTEAFNFDQFDDISMQASPSSPEEITKLETALRLSGEGVSLGLGKLGGAALYGGLEALLTPRITDAEKEETKFDRYNRLRKEYLQSEKADIAAAEEANPKIALASEIAGGAFLPMGGLAKGAKLAKDASLWKKIAEASKTMSKVGAATGGIAAVGRSEDITELPMDIAEGVVTGGISGAVLGGAAPAVAPVIKAPVRAAKWLGEETLNIPVIKATKELFKEGLKGSARDLSKSDAVKLLHDDIFSDIKIKSKTIDALKNDLGKKVEAAYKETKKVDLEKILSETRDDIQNKITNDAPNYSDRQLNELKEVLDIVDTKLIGKEGQVLRFKETPSMPPQYSEVEVSDFDKQLQRMTEKRALSNLRTDEPALKAGERLKEIQASKNILSEKLGADVSINEVVDTATGKRVITLNDKNGNILTKAISDANLTPIDLVTDPETGVSALKMVDTGTGKIQLQALRPEKPLPEKLYTKIDPIFGRSGGTPQSTPQEVRVLQGTLGDLEQVAETQVGKKTASDLRKSVGKIVDEQFKEIASSKKDYANMQEFYRVISGKDQLTPDELASSFRKLFQGAENETLNAAQVRDKLNTVLDSLSKVEPNLAAKMKNIYDPLLKEVELAQFMQQGSSVRALGGIQALMARAAYATGKATGKIGQSLGIQKIPALKTTTGGMTRLKTMGGDEAMNLSAQIANQYGKKGSVLSQKLQKLAGTKNERIRNSLMFTIMQDPESRKMLGIDSNVEE